MTAVVVLAICAAVMLVLVLPFRRGRQGPDSAQTASLEAETGHPRKGAGPAPAPSTSAVGPPPSKPPSSPLGAPARPPADDPATRARLDEKDRLLQAITELRFDFEAGKLSREDFESENASLRERAAAIIRETDQNRA